MSEPVAFVTRLAVREGRLEALKPAWHEAAAALDAGKPETLVFLSYLDAAGTQLTILHVFADAAAMDRHFEGSADRSRAAFEYVSPVGWEVYGRPSPSALETLREGAAAAAVALTVYPEFLSGFLHGRP